MICLTGNGASSVLWHDGLLYGAGVSQTPGRCANDDLWLTSPSPLQSPLSLSIGLWAPGSR